MSERTVTAARAVADLAYTSLALALIAFTLRAEIRRALTAKRAEIESHREAVADRARDLANRAGYLTHIAPKLVEREREPVAENMDAALAEFGADNA